MKLTKSRLKEIIREELLREASFKKLIIPNDTKTKKLVSNMIKKMKLKIDKDYDVRALKARGGNQELSILPKYYNKFLEFLAKNNIKFPQNTMQFMVVEKPLRWK